MQKFVTDALVLKTKVTGESDLIVFLLTEKKGIVRAFAKGARSMKSKLHAATALFSYASFGLYEKNDVYNVTDADLKESFFDLRTDLSRLSLGQYFCEVILKTVTEETDESTFYQLMLRSVYYLNQGKKDLLLLKSVFELRLAVIAGYAPPVHACAVCGTFLTDKMYFDCESGELFCADCGDAHALPEIPSAVVSAMRHIVYASFDQLFAFTLSGQSLEILNRLTQIYLQNCMQMKFSVLDYFWTSYR